MKKLFFLLISAMFLCSGCSDDDDSSPTSPSDTVSSRIAIYNDRGAWSEGTSRIYSLATSWGWSVEYVSAQQINSGYLDTTFGLVIFPGGDAGGYNSVINDSGESEIRGFVNNGGGYVGICAGAFWATDRIVWHGNSIDYPLNLVPGTATGPLDAICQPGNACWEDVVFTGSHPACGTVSGTISSYYFDGPEFDSPGITVLARYATTDTPAAVATESGSGRVAVIGIHPEMSTATHTVLQAMLEWTQRSTGAASDDEGMVKQSLSTKHTNPSKHTKKPSPLF